MKVWLSVGMVLASVGLAVAQQASPLLSCEQQLRQTTFKVNVADMEKNFIRDKLTEELRQALERAEQAEKAMAMAEKAAAAPAKAKAAEVPKAEAPAKAEPEAK